MDKSESGFAIVAVYVDDMNLIGTSEELQKTVDYLKREFEMKDLGKTKYCLGLQIEHSANGILVHQSTYTEKVLKRFGMDKAHPLSTPMVVRSLDTKKDPYRPKGDDEMVLGPEVPYLSAIGALLYLAQCTRPDISFSVNLLARYSSAPTWRHWTGIKHVLRYLRGTTDMGLFYSSESTNAQSIIGYADAGYLSDPHQGRSQTGYVFTCGGTAISWRSTKQTLVATSSNHSEILALHEASRECVWLRSVIHHIRSTCALPSTTDTPTILNEDNAACIAQITGGYIKVTGPNTYHQSFSIHMSSRRVKKSKSDKSAQELMESTDSSSGSQAHPQLPHRFRFRPTDEELVIHYLKRKAASASLPVTIIAEVDLYKFDPWELPSKATFGEQEWSASPQDENSLPAYPNGSQGCSGCHAAPRQILMLGRLPLYCPSYPLHFGGSSHAVQQQPRGKVTAVWQNIKATLSSVNFISSTPTTPSDLQLARPVYLKIDNWLMIRTKSSLILIIQLHQDLKILDDDIDMRAGSLSGTIHVNKRSDLKILDP
ncbi:NAC domain containing protein 25 [Prunus dulcis]|uniref:NAC domain containing protein 25 n=1 Tax=Prunus dulcis TaxID=3755 RepID=A0A4Y1QPK8_PRUDU|nr:NAC domain containing protein 25 [Prunus dulcis]